MAAGRVSRYGGSLASQLQSLFSPAPIAADFDPEEALGFGAELHQYNADEDFEQPQVTAQAPPSKRLRMMGPLAMDVETYSGKPANRSELFEERAGTELVTRDTATDDEQEEESEEEEGVEDRDDGDKVAAERLFSTAFLSGPSTDFEKEFDEIIMSDQQPQAPATPDGPSVALISAPAPDDAEKAKSVAAQVALWERALELRILSQRLLGQGSRLPHPTQHACFMSHGEAAQGYSGLSISMASVLRSMLSLTQAIREQNPTRNPANAVLANGSRAPEERQIVQDAVMAQPNGRPQNSADEGSQELDALWSRMDSEYQELKSFTNVALDRWHRKTLLTTGKLNLGKSSKLHALDQSISTQVANAMRNPDRLIKRARCQLDSSPVIGKGTLAAEAASGAEEGMDAYDPESYDDSEFYQQLLQEFLESSSAAELGALSGLKARKSKRKSTSVDRRASKGRKVRYTAMTPLVNFMAPELMPTSSRSESLFVRLFGKEEPVE